MSEAIKAMETGGDAFVTKLKEGGKKLAGNAAVAALIGASAPARIVEREDTVPLDTQE
jgi:hypothetical protein